MENGGNRGGGGVSEENEGIWGKVRRQMAAWQGCSLAVSS